MNSCAKALMGNICALSMKDEFKKIENLDRNIIKYRELTLQEISKLSEKILLLPFDLLKVLYFRYCFNSTAAEIDNVLETDDSEKHLLYVHKMLSNIMGLGDYWIADKSLKDASELALIKEMKDYNNVEILQDPDYSKKFRKELKEIKIKRKATSTLVLIAKRVAVFILILILSFSAFLTVNVEARTKFVDWVIERFPKFSIFASEAVDVGNNLIDIGFLNIGYVPDGYELEEIYEGSSMLVYYYLSGEDKRITISFALSDEQKSYYDTENADIEEFEFKEFPAFIWQTDQMTCMIWSQDGVDYHISGNIDKDEIIKVAEGISK